MKHIVKILYACWWQSLPYGLVSSRLQLFPEAILVTDLLCSIPWMLWSINGWNRANATSYLSPRGTSFTDLVSFVYCVGCKILLRPRTSSSIKGSMLDRTETRTFQKQPLELVIVIDRNLKCAFLCKRL